MNIAAVAFADLSRRELRQLPFRVDGPVERNERCFWRVRKGRRTVRFVQEVWPEVYAVQSPDGEVLHSVIEGEYVP